MSTAASRGGATFAALAQTAFDKTAHAQTGDELAVSRMPFAKNLIEALKAASLDKVVTDGIAFNGIFGPPTIGAAGSCHVPAVK
jgi:hypothetical protein